MSTPITGSIPAERELGQRFVIHVDLWAGFFTCRRPRRTALERRPGLYRGPPASSGPRCAGIAVLPPAGSPRAPVVLCRVLLDVLPAGAGQGHHGAANRNPPHTQLSWARPRSPSNEDRDLAHWNELESIHEMTRSTCGPRLRACPRPRRRSTSVWAPTRAGAPTTCATAWPALALHSTEIALEAGQPRLRDPVRGTRAEQDRLPQRLRRDPDAICAPRVLLERRCRASSCDCRPQTRFGHMLPRPLDLDILLYEDRVIQVDEDLVLPHPRAARTGLRPRVPLAEIAPGSKIPGFRARQWPRFVRK